MFLFKFLLVVVGVVSADPKGPGYDYTPPDTKKVEEVDQDRDTAAESACEDPRKYSSPSLREKCRSEEARLREIRAEERKKREAAQAATADQHADRDDKMGGLCDTKTIETKCVNDYIRSTDEKNDKNARRCEDSCSPSVFNFKKLTIGCSEEQKNSLISKLKSRQEICGVGGGACVGSEGACNAIEAAEVRRKLSATDADNFIACHHNGDMEACKVSMTREAYSDFVNTRDRDIADTRSASSYHSTLTTDLGDSVSVQKTYTADGGTDYSYKASDGTLHNSYEAAYIQSHPEGIPRPEPRPHLEISGGGGTTGGSTTGSAPRTPGGPSGGGTSSSTTAEKGTATSSQSTAKTETAQQQQAQQQTAASSGTSSGGAASGTSTGSSSSAYSNPFSNSNLTGGTTGGSSSSSSGYQALGKDVALSYGDEFTGSGGDGGFDGGSGGGYRNDKGRSAMNTTSREGTNRDAGFRTASQGGSVTDDAGARGGALRKSSIEQLGSSTFQSGYHKPSGKDQTMTTVKVKQSLAKMTKAARKKIMDRCKGNMSCIAKILGKEELTRGIASVKKLPSGVWSGYTDILSHMKKVHDKMPINHEGDIE